ncbi:MAG: hypothetical protein AB7P40_04355 [Chloroflexota bacterium]
MARFSVRYTLAALALSVSALAASPTTAALAAGPTDLGVSITADDTTVYSRAEVAFRVNVRNHTGSGGGTVKVMLSDYYRNVRMGNSTGGYRCTIGPDTFFDADVTMVTCTKSSIGNDVLTILAKAPSGGTFGTVTWVEPTNGPDPDDSDNRDRVDMVVKIPPGGIRID